MPPDSRRIRIQIHPPTHALIWCAANHLRISCAGHALSRGKKGAFGAEIAAFWGWHGSCDGVASLFRKDLP